MIIKGVNTKVDDPHLIFLLMLSYLLFVELPIISKSNKLVKNYVNGIKFVNRTIDQTNGNIDLLSRKKA
jgi:hypothetical protein